MPLVHLSLGSNLGDRCLYLRQALELIDAEFQLMSVSSIYETAAWGKTDQGDFLNLVAVINTELDPHTVLDKLQAIEQTLGRVRKIRWGERTIDIDILFYGEIIQSDERLELPHPRLWERAFVLVPLLEVLPGKTFHGRDLERELAGLADQSVRYYAASTSDC